jgi:hypothetical protein
MNDGVEQQAHRVYENVALLAPDLFARIIAMRIDAGPPFFGAFHALAIDDGGGRASAASNTIRIRSSCRCSVVAARNRASRTPRSPGRSRTFMASDIIAILNHGAKHRDSAIMTHSIQIVGTRLRPREVNARCFREINISDTQILRTRRADFALVWIVAMAVPLLLIAPALWNGYPLLQYDTDGYLARWYEGYLVPSRSTAYGIYLHLGEASHFWLNLGVQALSVMWIVQATLRVFGIMRPLRIAAVVLTLCATTALPVLTSLLLTDIFAGLSVLTLFLLVVHGGRFSRLETLFLFLFTSFAASTHSATLGVLFGLCCAGWILHPRLPARLSVQGLTRGSLTIVVGAGMLLASNFALSGHLARLRGFEHAIGRPSMTAFWF